MSAIEQVVDELPLATLLHRNEIVSFGQWMLSKEISSLIEIGTGPGGTTLLWGRLLSGLIVSIDLPTQRAIKIHNQLGMALRNFYSVLGDSQLPETELYLESLLSGMKVDLLFIDGDYGYESVKHDYETYKRFVRDHGWIALHNITASSARGMGVPTFWKELQGEKKEFTINADWGGIGVIQNNLPRSRSKGRS
jgi:hypothetical protein